MSGEVNPGINEGGKGSKQDAAKWTVQEIRDKLTDLGAALDEALRFMPSNEETQRATLKILRGVVEAICHLALRLK